MKNIFYRILLISILLSVSLVMPLHYPTISAIYFRLILIILITIESFKLFKNIFLDVKRNKILSNIGTALFSFYIIIILLETITMFVPKSHGVGYTLGSKLWFSKYWNPINSLGFRDTEPNNDKPAILFVGDSFTSGHGLKNADDRFSNIIKNELLKNGKDYNAINIGINGLDTRREFDQMKEFIDKTKINPEKIILQYFGNDIDNVAMSNGLKFSGFSPYSDVPYFLKPIIRGSYLFNFVYWLLPKQDVTPYLDFLTHAYKNDDIFQKHKNDLKLFIDYANENSTYLIVVVFPFMQDIEMSDSLYVNEIIKFFETNSISTVNVSTLVKNIPTADRMINVNDGHASKKINMIVANEILNKIN